MMDILGKIRNAECVQFRKPSTAATNAPMMLPRATDHHDDEHIDDDAQVHGVMQPHRGGICRRAAKASEKHPDRETRW